MSLISITRSAGSGKSSLRAREPPPLDRRSGVLRPRACPYPSAWKASRALHTTILRDLIATCDCPTVGSAAMSDAISVPSLVQVVSRRPAGTPRQWAAKPAADVAFASKAARQSHGKVRSRPPLRRRNAQLCPLDRRQVTRRLHPSGRDSTRAVGGTGERMDREVSGGDHRWLGIDRVDRDPQAAIELADFAVAHRHRGMVSFGLHNVEVGTHRPKSVEPMRIASSRVRLR